MLKTRPEYVREAGFGLFICGWDWFGEGGGCREERSLGLVWGRWWLSRGTFDRELDRPVALVAPHFSDGAAGVQIRVFPISVVRP